MINDPIRGNKMNPRGNDNDIGEIRSEVGTVKGDKVTAKAVLKGGTTRIMESFVKESPEMKDKLLASYEGDGVRFAQATKLVSLSTDLRDKNISDKVGVVEGTSFTAQTFIQTGDYEWGERARPMLPIIASSETTPSAGTTSLLTSASSPSTFSSSSRKQHTSDITTPSLSSSSSERSNSFSPNARGIG
jgi:hypothetical protein